jgi:predicted PurR-regulated permease PerM
MSFERQVAFWIVALAVFIAVLWLLSDVLLPFVAGMALAYLLDPIARRAERLGIGRGISALIVVTLVIIVIVVAVMAAAPIVGDQFVAFVDDLPGYLTKLHSIVSDPSRPWLAKVFGGNLPDPGKSGLAAAVSKLDGIDGISVVPFNVSDVVRHPIVGRIVQAYEGPDA